MLKFVAFSSSRATLRATRSDRPRTRKFADTGPGRSDLVARRVARPEENASTLTCSAENFFVILLGHLSTFQKNKQKSFPNFKVQNTHNNNRPQTIDTMFSRTERKLSSSCRKTFHRVTRQTFREQHQLCCLPILARASRPCHIFEALLEVHFFFSKFFGLEVVISFYARTRDGHQSRSRRFGSTTF